MNWQDVIAGAIVAAAALYLMRQAWLVFIRKQSSCGGGCKSCSADENVANGKPLVTLGKVKKAPGARERGWP